MDFTCHSRKQLLIAGWLLKVSHTYLEDLRVVTVGKAAEAADDHVLVHEDIW